MVRRRLLTTSTTSPDNPAIVVETLSRWKKIEDEGTQWLIRHAARTLVKQGNKDVLTILGYSPKVDISIAKIKIDRPIVKMGEELNFSFEIKSTSKQTQTLVIDYVIQHVKANGTRTPKVFKLTRKALEPGQAINLSKAHSFRPISTRKYYAGQHALEIQVNGTIYAKTEFMVK
jgi:hypothetical protein